jgi:hypothetical protein
MVGDLLNISMIKATHLLIESNLFVDSELLVITSFFSLFGIYSGYFHFTIVQTV